MMCGDPFLDEFYKCLGLRDNLFRLGLGGHERTVVINHISFPSAVFKEIQRPGGGGAECETRRLEHQTMMSWHVRKAIPGAGNGHLGCLKSCVICGSESSVFRQFLDRRVRQVSGDECAESIQLL